MGGAYGGEVWRIGFRWRADYDEKMYGVSMRLSVDATCN